MKILRLSTYCEDKSEPWSLIPSSFFKKKKIISDFEANVLLMREKVSKQPVRFLGSLDS